MLAGMSLDDNDELHASALAAAAPPPGPAASARFALGFIVPSLINSGATLRLASSPAPLGAPEVAPMTIAFASSAPPVAPDLFPFAAAAFGQQHHFPVSCLAFCVEGGGAFHWNEPSRMAAAPRGSSSAAGELRPSTSGSMRKRLMRRSPTLAWMAILITAGRKVSDTDSSWKSVSEVKPCAAEIGSPIQSDFTRNDATAASVGAVSHIVDVMAPSFWKRNRVCTS
mmetsp:Transcript_20785/g.53008  ORF Transcript_20785/g.53008 Transcript_20785/m.53008 type:complete len:226 (-) Transcript_20785:1545-2222(-)